MFGSRHRRPATRWRRLVAALVVTAVAATGNLVTAAPARADNGPVTVDEGTMRRGLFSAYMRTRAQGHDGLRQMFLSAEMVGYRQQHPGATAKELLDHTVSMNGWYSSQLGAQDLERPLYQFVVKLMELSALHPAGTVTAPIMTELVQSTLGTQLTQYGGMVDEVYAAQAQHSVITQVFANQDRVWGEVAGRGAIDPAFAEAWNGYFGGKYQILATASQDQLLADPVLGTFINVQSLMDRSQNTDDYIRQGNAMLRELLEKLNAKVDEGNAAIAALQLPFPVQGASPTQADLDRAKADAARRQQWIDGAAAAVRLLSTLVGFANQRAGQIVAGTGNAAVQIATAVNNWLPVLAAKGLGAALFSMSGIGMAASVLGAIQSLVPLFGRQGPSPEQQILDQLAVLRQEVGQFRDEMHDRFDRVDAALSLIFDQMQEQFGQLLLLHQATDAQLKQVIRDLAALTVKVDFWGHALYTALQQDKVTAVDDIFNDWVDYRQQSSRDMTYDQYYTAATGLQKAASNWSTTVPMAAPAGGAGVQDTLGLYGYDGSMAYLSEYARANLGLPKATTGVPAVEYWLLAAEGYKLLLAQNPDHARMTDQITGRVIDAGERIQAAARDLSRPQGQAGGQRLNPVFVNLLKQYQDTAEAMTGRMHQIRDRHRNGHYDYTMFGAPDQEVPKPAAEPGTVAFCDGGAVTYTPSRPANVVSLDLQQMWVAEAGGGASKARTCFDVDWVNVTEPSDPHGDRPYAVNADLQVTFRVEQVWDGQPLVARSWTKVYPYGKIEQYYPPGDSRRSWFVSAHDAMAAKWATTYRPAFEQSATYANPGEEVLKTKTRNWIYGQAGQYYTDVYLELTRPDGKPYETSLHDLNAKLTETTLLLQAYTKLAFARSTDQDELIGLYLFGKDRLPSDNGAALVTTPFWRAYDNYCSAITADSKCVLRSTGVLDPRASHDPALPCTWPESVDPIERCFDNTYRIRSARLQERLEAASVRLATVPGFQEGIPAVDYLLQAIRTAEAVAKH